MSDFDPYFFAVFTPYVLWVAGVFGALWGSFANVVIARWPREMSVVRPGSHCFSCGAPIRFYDNIPIVSYLLLRGRCRACHARFSPRYILVEALLGLLATAVAHRVLASHPPTLAYGLTSFFFGFGLCFALITAALIDLDTFLLPDAITLPGIAVGLVVNVAVLRDLPLWDVVAGSLGCFLFLHIVFVKGYARLTGRQGMGEGDPKLLAMIGACLGVQGALFALVGGAAQGLVAGVAMVVLRRRARPQALEPQSPREPLQAGATDFDPDAHPALLHAAVPFGPFLALGALEYYFGARDIIGNLLDSLLARFTF
ncbi:MAG: prepilin peptidase [Myxococcota bacterium]|jgi:leader peptidase (prepilin peptidase)/N-methyltransferase|nr:prepilin peptidase [Myxococcota bacterium]